MALLGLGGCAVIPPNVSKYVKIEFRPIPNVEGGLTIVLTSTADAPQKFRTEIDIKPRPNSDPLITDPLLDVRDLAAPGVRGKDPDPDIGPETIARVRIPIGTRWNGPILQNPMHAHSGHARRVIVEL